MQAYRIADRKNIHLAGRPVTSFALFERRPHPVQGDAYEFVSKYMATGHDATDQECITAAEAEIYGDENAC